MPRRLYYSLLGGLHPPSTNPSSEDFQATAKKGVTVLTEFFELQADFPASTLLTSTSTRVILTYSD